MYGDASTEDFCDLKVENNSHVFTNKSGYGINSLLWPRVGGI